MDVVIMGAGRVGLNLALFLISDGHDVTIIEKDEEKCQSIASDLDATVICGNGTYIDTLEKSDVEDADIFVAATGNDESNLLACILAKDYKIPKTIARLSDPNHKKAFKKVGIDIVVNPEVTAAHYLEKLLLRPNIADLAIIGNKNYIIVAVYLNGDIVIPEPDMVLKQGVKISILVKTKFSKDVLKRFTKGIPIYDSLPPITGTLNHD